MEGFPWYIKMCILPNFESIGPQFFFRWGHGCPQKIRNTFMICQINVPQNHTYLVWKSTWNLSNGGYISFQIEFQWKNQQWIAKTKSIKYWVCLLVYPFYQSQWWEDLTFIQRCTFTTILYFQDTCQLLTLCMLGKNSSRWHLKIFFLFFLENRIWHFMQKDSLGDNLHEVSDPIF